MSFKFKSKGKAHSVQELITKLRQTFLDFGLNEVINSMIINDSEIYKQYGPEAAAILDRCFYLAELPRPEIGISKEKIAKIQEIVPEWKKNKEAKLRELLREYKKGNIEGDDFLEELVKQLGITTQQAARILDEVFTELKDLKPQPTTKTLRSHMTSAWFPVLAEAQEKFDLPIGFFSIGPRFRREQRLDSTHLYESTTASVVVMDKSFSEQEIFDFVKKLCEKLGFKQIKIIRKKATAQYYENNKEWEVYASIDNKDVEIADFGLYSNKALKEYKITYPVFNIGFGVERLAMILTKSKDIRDMVYWHIKQKISLSDKQLIEQIKIDKKPTTKQGELLKEAIKKTAKQHASEKSPCRFTAFEGEFLGKKIKVSVVEEEKNTKLLGPACLNEIYAFEGSIYGISHENSFKGTENIKNKGIKANFDFLDAISSYFAAKTEDLVLQSQNKDKGNKIYKWQIKMAKTPTDINIKVSQQANKFITSNNKEIMLKGPIFMSVVVEFL